MKTPIETALNEFGTKSIAGLLHNAEVVKYFKGIGQAWVKDDETAWCAAFLNWVLMKSGKMYTSSLLARSFMHYGTPTTTPQVGDIVVLWRGNKYGPFGHCGLFIKQTNELVYILGGNQADQVSIESYSKTQLLGYRQIPLATRNVV